MRYFLYNNCTKQSVYFASRQAMHKWIVRHFRQMSPHSMSCWVVCPYAEYNLLMEQGARFSVELRSRIVGLSDYILSFLKF